MPSNDLGILAEDALDRFEWLCAELRPYCERIALAGSLRRGNQRVKDLELVVVPKFASVGDSLFEGMSAEVNTLDKHLATMLVSGSIKKRVGNAGGTSWGPRAKFAVYEGVPVDIFSVIPPAQWGLILAIRTGPAEFSMRITTSRLYGGLLPPGLRVSDGQVWKAGKSLPIPEEDDWFDLLGMKTPRPEDRK